MITPRRTIYENVEIERFRSLPIAGRAYCEEGDFVSYDKVILGTEIRGDVFIVRLSERLGIDQEVFKKGVLVKSGISIKKGDLLFEKKSFISFLELREFSPVDGVIEFVNYENGHIGIRLLPKTIEVKAFFPGKVKQISNDRTVVLNSQVGLLQGVIGYGSEGVGKIIYLKDKDDKILTENDLRGLEGFFESLIIVGGRGFSEGFFKAVRQLPVVGIVTSSLNSKDIYSMFGTSVLGNNPSYPEDAPIVILTEGFGSLCFSTRASTFFSRNNEKLASISGLTQVRAGAIRPELLIHEVCQDVPPIIEMNSVLPKVGDLMRVVRGQYFGQIGSIINLPSQMQKLESGVESYTADLDLKGRKVSVSLANLESL